MRVLSDAEGKKCMECGRRFTEDDVAIAVIDSHEVVCKGCYDESFPKAGQYDEDVAKKLLDN